MVANVVGTHPMDELKGLLMGSVCLYSLDLHSRVVKINDIQDLLELGRKLSKNAKSSLSNKNFGGLALLKDERK